MSWQRWLGAGLLLVLAASCGPALRDPVSLRSPSARLDLRAWNFAVEGPVNPQDWLWDAGVLWSPEQGRPEGSLSPELLPGPDRGGVFTRTLGLGIPGRPAVATAHLQVLVVDRQSYGLQIGAFPGAYRVWVNGVLVGESGVLSADPDKFRADGAGMVLTVQPRDGVLDVVAELATADPLVQHHEMNRLWILGPAESMAANDRSEQAWRSVQATVLVLGILVFLWISTLRPERRALVFFSAFLAVCLLKLLFNVEQPTPFLAAVVPGLPQSLYLFLNHGLNLLPFPLMVLFLVRQFPGDVSVRSLVVLSSITGLLTLWELAPFLALASGAPGVYESILAAGWTFSLNLYVVLTILFIFERYYHLYTKRRPLATALFFGGILIGLVVLAPIPLSYFLPVKYTYFLGWGMFAFLVILIFELVRIQVRTTDAEVQTLADEVQRRESWGRFIAPGWAARLGKGTVDGLRPGDHRSSDAVLVQVWSPDSPDHWLAAAGPVALARQALLVDWREGTATWALDDWSETALAFGLELQRRLTQLQGLRFRIVLTRAQVEFRILDAGPQWLPTVQGLPLGRLAELQTRAERFGVGLAVDVVLQDGLAVGGWKRHRNFTVEGTEIELYEAEDAALAELKDQHLDAFEAALVLARSGRIDEAVQTLFPVAQKNPFDLATRAHLAAWGPPQRT